MRYFTTRNRAILREMIVTDFKIRYQGSVLGYLWSLLKPLFMFAIIYVVFTFVFGLGKGVPLPPTMSNFEDMVATIEQMPHEELLVECKFAITKEFDPCEYFDKKVWFRAIADVLKINKMVALAVDYKTGKILEDSQQLALVAATVFAHFPQVQAVRCEFWWLKDDAKSEDVFYRKDMPDMWRALWPRIQALEQAHETMTFPPKPGYLCRKWCPVVSCPHHGK